MHAGVQRRQPLFRDAQSVILDQKGDDLARRILGHGNRDCTALLLLRQTVYDGIFHQRLHRKGRNTNMADVFRRVHLILYATSETHLLKIHIVFSDAKLHFDRHDLLACIQIIPEELCK